MNLTRRIGSLLALALFSAVAAPLSLGARDPGPIAIGMTNANSAIILQSDGRLIAFDTKSHDAGKVLYRVPAAFQAVDVAAAPFRKGAITCFTLNAKPTPKPSVQSASASEPAPGSFVMQLMPDRREVWTWMPERGVYIGVAVDGDAGVAYTTNSTTGGVFRVVLGDQRAPVVEVARIIEADRIGTLALDAAGERLFVADIAMGRLFVVPLTPGRRMTTITIPDAEEIRAVAWSPLARKVFVADSAQEAVWSIDPERPENPVRLRDPRLREPSGLTTTRDGHVWLVDEGAKSVFQLSAANNTVLHAVKWK